MSEQKTCFVVQGFGEKTDLTNGRKLNLDASYLVIKEAIEDAGLKCIRADEIVHSGTIDKPMYQWIYEADLLIADLSTYNINAVYELGVRYGVRPRTTMIVAEDQFKNPFDVSHIVVRSYKHLGDDIGAQEARRFKRDLTAAIKEIMEKGDPDSPVYTYLTLEPPGSRPALREAAVQFAPPSPPADQAQDTSAKQFLDQARAAMAADQFALAKALFEAVRTMRPRDEFVVQQLALATYKSKLPDALAALKEAQKLLQTLDPASTNNPETLGLWGAVHKRLWELSAERPYLDVAIEAYERGFYLKQDYYNGINLAFLYNVRADVASRAGAVADAIADFVLARRVRRDVVHICERALGVASSESAQNPLQPETTDLADAKYWITATLWEAAVGLDDAAGTAEWRKAAEAAAAAPWMIETTKAQVAKLVGLLANSPLKVLAAL